MRCKFRNRIEFFRLSRGLSRCQLAYFVDVNPLDIFLYERNFIFPSSEIALKLCRVLVVDFSELFYIV